MINTTTDEPSMIEEYKHDGPPKKSKYLGSNTGKWKPSDLVTDKMATFDNNL